MNNKKLNNSNAHKLNTQHKHEHENKHNKHTNVRNISEI